MAKDKKVELERKIVYLQRMHKRKKDRLAKFTENRKFRKKSQCTCGEDPYCYCGDGTPYSY